MKPIFTVHAGEYLVGSEIEEKNPDLRHPAMCWETRGLNKLDQEQIAIGAYKNRQRNLTPYLNDWKTIEKLNKNT